MLYDLYFFCELGGEIIVRIESWVLFSGLQKCDKGLEQSLRGIGMGELIKNIKIN